MTKYLVRIEAEIEVEADCETGAEITAAQCFDFGSAEFEVEEIDDVDPILEVEEAWVRSFDDV